MVESSNKSDQNSSMSERGFCVCFERLGTNHTQVEVSNENEHGVNKFAHQPVMIIV